MVLSLTYRRPSHVSEDSQASMDGKERDPSLRSSQLGVVNGIPNAISFDNIIRDATCPPVTIRDFMNYLTYIEHTAENLQFYLWHQNFVKRFAEAATSDLQLAPEWTKAREAEAALTIQKETSGSARLMGAAAIFKDSDFEKRSPDYMAADENPFSTPPLTPLERSNSDTTCTPSMQTSDTKTYRSQANEAFAAAGVRSPFTIQPYREEIDRIVSTYIMDGAPRQLNLSDRDRRAVLHALSYTTHPSALRIAFQAVDNSLRLQCHPNFIRWSICNGNPPRVTFARGLGIGGITAGFVTAILLTLSNVHCRYRALAAIGWFIGVATLVMGYKGLCICMYSFGHHRHIHPWELFVDEEKVSLEKHQQRSSDAFGPSNSFEQEPWLVKYADRNIVRKIFDREAWIQDPSLRAIQDTIFLQAIICAFLSAAVCTAVFVALPAGKFY